MSSIHRINPPPVGHMRLTLVGSGASTGVPVIGHFGGSGCACEDAIAHPTGPHARNNASLLITVRAEGTSSPVSSDASNMTTRSSFAYFTSPMINSLGGVQLYHTMVDCGKTFRDAYFRVLTKEDVRSLDALFLTSAKPCAMAGVDDLRDLQSMSPVHHGEWLIHHYIPTYMLPSTKQGMEHKLRYIIRNSLDIGGSHTDQKSYEEAWERTKQQHADNTHREWNNIGIRRSTSLQLITVPDARPTLLYVPPFKGTPVYSVPVRSMVNGAETSMGLVFGRGTRFKSDASAPIPGAPSSSCVVYLPDICGLPDASSAFLDDLAAVDLLVVDCLHRTGKTSDSHWCLEDVAQLTVRLRPKHVVTTGMSCDIRQGDIEAELGAALQKEVDAGRLPADHGVEVTMGYDGYSITLPA